MGNSEKFEDNSKYSISDYFWPTSHGALEPLQLAPESTSVHFLPRACSVASGRCPEVSHTRNGQTPWTWTNTTVGTPFPMLQRAELLNSDEHTPVYKEI